MSLNTLLAVIILVSFIVTVVLAVGSYTAYKIRERRRPSRLPQAGGEEVYFERYVHQPVLGEQQRTAG
ncbi:MAG TPA: hypothetical protein VGQ52_02585 [Gemmatimonadaceae bacterium]|jgi:heme/copper-type cytochrome/quinol oxidase subunit 2|nr:hypothetical protein [Gemmatimonadaceae bacterium]